MLDSHTVLRTPPSPPLLYRVTVEHVAFAALTLVVLAVRLIGLGVQPLAPVEAAAALRAWQASQGLGPVLDAGVPLLFGLQTLIFSLFGAGAKTWPESGDGIVRLWSVVASIATLWVIFDWRRWLSTSVPGGRAAALVAGVLFAFSPLASAFARRGDGVAFVLLALALMLAGWGRLGLGDRRGWTLAAVGGGLALISGPAGVSALLASAVLLLFSRRTMAVWPRPGLTDGVVFLIIVVFGGTALLTHVSALGLAALNWSDWLGAFSLAPRDWLWGLIRLVVDEPFLVPVGVASTLWLWRRRAADQPHPAYLLGLAALVMMVVAVAQGPYAAGARAVVALLFTAPVAVFILTLFRRLDLSQPETLLYVVVLQLLLIVAFLYLLHSVQNTGPVYLAQMVVAVAASVVLAVLFGFFLGARTVLIHTAFVLIMSLFLLNIASAWGLAFDPSLPRFSALYERDSRIGLRDLTRTVGDLSEMQKGERWALPVALIAGGASTSAGSSEDVLRWYLRNVPDLQVVQSVDPAAPPPIVIAPENREVPLTDTHSGQRFTAWEAWDPSQGDTRQIVSWALFRTAPWTLPVEKVVLWADSQIITPPTLP